MVDREALIKEFEGYSIEQLENALNTLLEYKQSPKMMEDIQVNGQQVMTNTNQRIHTINLLLNSRRKENLRNTLDAMLKEYSEDENVDESVQVK